MTKRGMIFGLVVMMILAAAAAVQAAPVPSQLASDATSEIGSAQQQAAEQELVKAALMDCGLTDEEAQSRVDLLTAEEIHLMANDLDAIRAGGERVWTTTEVLLALILVAVIVS